MLGDELTAQLPAKADFQTLQADFKALDAKFDGLDAKFDGLRSTSIPYSCWSGRS